MKYVCKFLVIKYIALIGFSQGKESLDGKYFIGRKLTKDKYSRAGIHQALLSQFRVLS